MLDAALVALASGYVAYLGQLWQPRRDRLPFRRAILLAYSLYLSQMQWVIHNCIIIIPQTTLEMNPAAFFLVAQCVCHTVCAIRLCVCFPPPQVFAAGGRHQMADQAEQFKAEVEAFQQLVPLLKVMTDSIISLRPCGPPGHAGAVSNYWGSNDGQR
jgi:hypothetical protein